MRVIGLLCYSLVVAKTFGAEEIPWDELSEQLGPGILREIGPMDMVFETCVASIEAFGGAELPSIANGTCSFAGACVFENCQESGDDTASAVGESGLFVESDTCNPSLATCAEASPCYDHDVGICGEDGVIVSEDCASAVPFCNPCFPNSRCGALGGGEEDDSSAFVESESCTSVLAGCAEASACYDHTLGLCAEDGTISEPNCVAAVPSCNPCFPNSRCGALEAVENGSGSSSSAVDETLDESGVFITSEACSPELAGCAEAAPCFDHTIGLCAEDGSISAPDCAEAGQFCGSCFPKSRCGVEEESNSVLFVESEACSPELAGCAEAAPCFDHDIGLCAEDGSISAPDCAEAAQFCSSCFPNSRCGGNEGTPEGDSDLRDSVTKNLPLYSVIATTLDHVQKTVEFASRFGIPLSIKSTGASYSVANQYNDNLLLSMSSFPKHSGGIDADAMSTITGGGVIENYVDPCGNEHGPAIEIGGGETFGDVFGSLVAYNNNRGEGETKYMLSSGAAVTVGASGGWLMGGGLGPFDRSMGLGIDNVIAFKVVTAQDGVAKVVHECDEETSDLFWALRGGGGGNFGVIVSQISKLHPVKSLVRANVMWMGADVVTSVTDALPEGITISGDFVPDNLARGSIGTRQTNLAWTKPTKDSLKPSMEQLDSWWDAMLTVLNPVTMDHNIDGYYGIGCAWAGGYMCADLYFLGSMEEFESIILAPLREVLEITALPNATVTVDGPGAAGTGQNFIYIAQEYRDGYYSYASQDCLSALEGSPEAFVCTDLGYPSANGYNTDVFVGQGEYETRLSWMIGDYIFGNGTAGNPENEATIDQAKALFSEPLMLGVTGHVLGGAVNTIATEDSTATSPVMRSSALEGLFPPDLIKYVGVQESMDVLIKYLPAPESGPIFNHDALNLDFLNLLGKPENLSWQDLYWGSNLAQLREIKAKYDPTNVFQCRDCLTVDQDFGDNDEETDIVDTTAPLEPSVDTADPLEPSEEDSDSGAHYFAMDFVAHMLAFIIPCVLHW